MVSIFIEDNLNLSLSQAENISNVEKNLLKTLKLTLTLKPKFITAASNQTSGA